MRALNKETASQIEECQRAVDLAPERADLRLRLGVRHASQGDHGAAMAEYRHVLARDPDNAAAHWLLGASLMQMDQFQDALEKMREAIRLDPRNAVYRMGPGHVHVARQRLDEAIPEFGRAWVCHPLHLPALAWLIRCLYVRTLLRIFGRKTP